jgi:hypothetical protein
VAWAASQQRIVGQAGHRVTVLEAAERLSEVGAGIQLGPNLTRLLIGWGLHEKLKRIAVIPEAITFQRCKPVSADFWLRVNEINRGDGGESGMDEMGRRDGEIVRCSLLPLSAFIMHIAPKYLPASRLFGPSP